VLESFCWSLKPSQPSRLVGPRTTAGPVGPRGTLRSKELPVPSKSVEESDPSELAVLSKELFQVIAVCCGL
jgi:hypothetical protein